MKRKVSKFAVRAAGVLFIVVLSVGNNLAEDSGARDNQQAKAFVSIVDGTIASEIASTVLQNSDKLAHQRIAVSDFTDIEGTELLEGQILAEQIVARIVQEGTIVVVERKQLETVLSEQKLELTGVVDVSDGTIGKVLDVDAIVTGTIAHLENAEEINAKMIDVKTGALLCMANPKRNNKQVQQEFSRIPGLSQEKKQQLNAEFSEREKMMFENPALYRYKKELVSLRAKDPVAFRKVVRTIRYLGRLRRDKQARLFLMATGDKNNKKLKRLKKKNPQQYERVLKIRQSLDHLYEKVPSFKAKLAQDRNKVLKKMKDAPPHKKRKVKKHRKKKRPRKHRPAGRNRGRR